MPPRTLGRATAIATPSRLLLDRYVKSLSRETLCHLTGNNRHRAWCTSRREQVHACSISDIARLYKRVRKNGLDANLVQRSRLAATREHMRQLR